MSRDKTYYAHSENLGGQPELLLDHLLAVAQRAESFASPFGHGNSARIAGLLHDLGKYADQFQQRLVSPSRVPGKDHWSAGAAVLLSCFKRSGIPCALVVEGHHTGLGSLPASLSDYEKRLRDLFSTCSQRVTDSNLNELFNRWKIDGMPVEALSMGPNELPAGILTDGMLDLRMLFSALVDADFLETEAHFEGDTEEPRRPRPDGPKLSSELAIHAVSRYVNELPRSGGMSEPIQAHRDELWRDCQLAAERPTGLYTLTAPTGMGKTLAALGFALQHAKIHGLRRVILVMPYLNIIDQTVQVYSRCFNRNKNFPEHFILEDHSLANEGNLDHDVDTVNENERCRRLLAQNWDAPIVLTTNVKCLESLMANRSSSCRKIHRMARSVILFDEVQTFPPRLVVPTLATLARLADPSGPYRSTVVFATATQPAFDHLDCHIKRLSKGGWRPQEIVSDPVKMFMTAAKRVHTFWHHNTPMSMEGLCDELTNSGSKQILCIVNLKRHARDLFTMLADRGQASVMHLSTSMCPEHRRCLLKLLTSALQSKDPVTLVATQCVEAGVDLDFPVVYRALAPMDSIAQAAGRCNRHGVRPERGRLTVFELEDGGRVKYPPGYEEAVAATQALLSMLKHEHSDLDTIEILNSPAILRRYFQTLYDLTGRGGGTRRDEQALREAIDGGDFAEVARLYRLIPGDMINILVPYDHDTFKNLVDEMGLDQRRTPGSIRNWIARAQPFAVGVFRPKPDSAVWKHLTPIQFSRREATSNAEASWFHVLPSAEYYPMLGLRLPEDQESWIV